MVSREAGVGRSGASGEVPRTAPVCMGGSRPAVPSLLGPTNTPRRSKDKCRCEFIPATDLATISYERWHGPLQRGSSRGLASASGLGPVGEAWPVAEVLLSSSTDPAASAVATGAISCGNSNARFTPRRRPSARFRLLRAGTRVASRLEAEWWALLLAE